MNESIAQAVASYRAAILETLEQLHRMPEWGLQEHRTSAHLKAALAAAGIPIQELTETGFVAELTGKEPGLYVGLRADLDALPFIDEAGQTYYAHTCGHDAHATIGLWTLKVLKELELVKRGRVRVIFQPAEERLVGAKLMVEAGAGHLLDELYGVHIRPQQEARLGQAAAALWHRGSTVAESTIKGRPAHGARPHLGVNAIDGAALAVLGVNSLWANPAQQWSAKVTKLAGGGVASNIIPDRAVLTMDLRAESNGLMEEITGKARVACLGAAAAIGGTADFKLLVSVPAAAYDREAIGHLAAAITEVLGPEGLLMPIRSPGSDDFHEFRQANPQLKTAFLALGADATPGLHDPQMTFAPEAVLIGVHILALALARRVAESAG
ncbi:MAG TPA: amidohydrolase [Clostridiales bacterium UBA8153]|nr:amidohydrolase [Clostridiales bacterium UBA8153]